MRQIKFRGKNNSGKWVYGSLVHTEGQQPKIYFPIFFSEDPKKLLKWDWVYVDEKTVGQFTGLLDKNGNEIYENDIVGWQQYGFTGKKTDTIKGVVYFDTDCGAYGINTGLVENFTWLRIFYKEVNLGDIAVIGNIHEKH